MGDPFDVKAALAAVRGSAQEMLSKQQAAQLAKSVMALRNAQNTGNTKSGSPISAKSNVAAPSTPVGNSGGGGVAAPAAAPVDPATAMQGMVGALKTMSGAEIAALMEQIKANYAQYVGDIDTTGTEWLQNLLGANFDTSDPNFAAMMADPAIASYMGSMEQMGETGDQNLATDLSWFLKQQEMYNQYLDTIPLVMAQQAASGGGGGGGGGGGYGRGGGGGGGSSDDDTQPFETEKFAVSKKLTDFERASSNSKELNPGLDEAFFGRLPEIQSAFLAAGIPISMAEPIMRDAWDATGGAENPQGTVEDIVNTFLPDIESQLNQNSIYEENNAALLGSLGLPGQGGGFDSRIQHLASLLGNLVVDDPETDEFEYMSPNPDLSGVIPSPSPDDEDFITNFSPLYETYMNPENYDNNTLMGKGQAGLQRAINYFNTYRGRRQIGAPVHQEDAMAQYVSPSSGVLSQLQSIMNPAPSPDDYITDDEHLPPADPDWFYHNSEDAANSTSTNSNPGQYDYMHIPPEEMTDREFNNAYYAMPAVQQLRRYLLNATDSGNNTQQGGVGTNTNAMRAYWEDVYPNLRPMDQVVVNRVLEQSGVRIPNEAAAAYSAQNPDRNDPEIRKQALRDFFASPEGMQINMASSANLQSLVNEQHRGPAKYSSGDLAAITGHDVTNYNMLEDGVLAPNILEAVKRATNLQGHAVQGNSPIEIDPWQDNPGTYWKDDTLTPEEIRELQGMATGYNILRDTINYGGFNPTTDLAPDTNTLVQASTAQDTGTLTAADTDESFVDADELDVSGLVPSEPVFGGRGFMSPTSEASSSSLLNRSIMDMARNIVNQQAFKQPTKKLGRSSLVNTIQAPKLPRKIIPSTLSRTLATSKVAPSTIARKRPVKLRP